MQKNIPLVISVIINVILIVLLGTYLFTPYLDYAVLNKSMPRICDYFENDLPDVTPPTFCE